MILQAVEQAGVGINTGVLSGAHDQGRLQQVDHTQIRPSIADILGFLTKDETCIQF